MDLNSKSMDQFIKELAYKHKVSEKTIRVVVRSQFEFTKQVMKGVDSYNDFWPEIRLAKLGSFIVKEGKKRFFKEKSASLIKQLMDVHTDQE